MQVLDALLALGDYKFVGNIDLFELLVPDEQFLHLLIQLLEDILILHQHIVFVQIILAILGRCLDDLRLLEGCLGMGVGCIHGGGGEALPLALVLLQ